MSTYRGINGFATRTIAGDPGSIIDGQVWYNSSTASFRLGKVLLGSWSTTANINETRLFGAGCGTNSAALAMGGAPGATPYPTQGSSWNNIAWTAVSGLNTNRQGNSASGPQTSAISSGGWSPSPTTNSESWAGSSWTATPSLNTARGAAGAAGTSNTSALTFGGYQNPPAGSVQSATESYNGSWTTVSPGLNTARWGLGGAGTATAALAISGSWPNSPTPPSQLKVTESYNGSWTTVSPDTLSIGSYVGGSCGTQTSALYWGGNGDPGVQATRTQSYNGVWTNGNNLLEGTRENGSAGSSNGNGLTFAGDPFGSGPNQRLNSYAWNAGPSTITFASS